MSSSWVPFLDAVTDISAGHGKVPTSEFREAGALAVVDQGQNLVAGYTDDVARRVGADDPVIVFGDHTRAFKYVDFPFAMGADGVKVLRPSSGFDARYLYHYLASRTIPSAGYSRHYKYLKQLTIPRPPLVEQRRVAVILDQADAVRSYRGRVLTHLGTLENSLFVDIFGDPVGGAGGTTVDDAADIQIGPFGSLLHSADYVVGGVPLINPMHILDGVIRPDHAFSVRVAKAESLATYRLNAGDVVLGRRGEMGRCAVVGESQEGFLCGTGALIVRPRSGVSSSYLRAALSHHRTRAALQDRSIGSTLPNLNATIVKRLPMLIPPTLLQEDFETKLRGVRGQRARAKRAFEADEELFVSVQYRAFRGEL